MAVERRPNFDFIEMGIPVGSELVAVSDPTVKVIVKDNRKVIYNGQEYFLSKLEEELNLQGNPCGHWYYKEKGLNDIYNETYEKKESMELTPKGILKAFEEELNNKYNKQFSVSDPWRDHNTFIWIGDKQHLIGAYAYHYEIVLGNSKGHDGKHAYVELHLGEQTTKKIANYFGETVKTLEENSEINGFNWEPGINSLRLEKGKNGHIFTEKNLITVLFKELIELDSIVGPAIRKKISEYEREKRIRELIDNYKKLLKKTNNTTFIDDELYKWKYITECKDSSALDFVNYMIKNNSNLIDTPRVMPGWKELLNNNPTGFEKTINNLLDESQDFETRIQTFENEMESLFKPYPKYNVFANDERTASCFLGCKYPQKYTFFKPEKLYEPLCFALGEESKNKRFKYKHFLELLYEMIPYIKSDSELQTIINQKTKDYIKSDLLTAQNICYCVFQKRAQEMLGEKTMTTKSKELIEYTDLLSNKLNVILQGAPGTGKTYTTASLALSICDEDLDYNDRDAVMKRYKELREEGRIGFCTFHQSMDYEDFIEGLKPQSDGSDKVIYDVEDGLFKRICKKALEDGNSESDNFEKSLQKFVEKLNAEEKITIPTKTGKSFTVYLNQYGDGLVDEQPNYSRFYNFKQLYNVYRGLPGVPNKGHDNYRRAIIDYMQDEKNGIGLKQYNPSAQSSGKKAFVLIIDEINRGYVSKIFGELITLLETDKRLGNPKTELTVELPYSKETFGVPKNLYIIGTMNTTDRSTGTLDYAVRRRFSFVTLAANEKILEDTDACIEAKDLFNDVKSFIDNNKLEDFDIGDLMVGHSYFMTDNTEVLKQKIKYEVIPLVKEYIKDGILTCLSSEAKPYFDDWLELKVHDSQKIDE